MTTASTGSDKDIKHDTYDKTNEKNPLSRKFKETYRYCPLSAEDEGDYVFEVMGYPRGNSERRCIYWEIYNEHDKKLHKGDAHTKMTFNWVNWTSSLQSQRFKPTTVC